MVVCDEELLAAAGWCCAQCLGRFVVVDAGVWCIRFYVCVAVCVYFACPKRLCSRVYVLECVSCVLLCMREFIGELEVCVCRFVHALVLSHPCAHRTNMAAAAATQRHADVIALQAPADWLWREWATVMGWYSWWVGGSVVYQWCN